MFLVGFLWTVTIRHNPLVKIGQKNSLDVSITDNNRLAHPLVFFDKDAFYRGVEEAKTKNKIFIDHAFGGIVPHHLFPGFIITDFFNRLSKQNPNTIILIGPNHYERGDYHALASLYKWETPFGTVDPNEQVIQELVKNKMVQIDENVLPEDHAVAGMMPFIKYYLPNTKVVPILLSGFMTEIDTQILSNELKNYVDSDSVIIAAVDFSHNLTNQQAQEKDRTTLELMRSFNYKQLLSLNNEYLDSPSSITVFLKIMQALGTTKMEIFYHTNSGELQKNDYIETTSYFSIAYYKL